MNTDGHGFTLDPKEDRREDAHSGTQRAGDLKREDSESRVICIRCSAFIRGSKPIFILGSIASRGGNHVAPGAPRRRTIVGRPPLRCMCMSASG